MRHLENRFYKTIVIIWLTLSVGSVILAAISWVQLSTRLAEGRKMTGIREDLDDILRHLVDAETATRGYVITTNASFLAPLNEAMTNIPARFDHLVELSRNDSTFLKEVTILRGQAEVTLNWQHQIIKARDRSFNRAAELIASGEGKKVMDDVRVQMVSLGQARFNQLVNIREQIHRQISRASSTSLAAGVGGVGAGLLAFWLTMLAMRQQKRERELMEAKLQAEHNSLEKTVFLANMSHEIRTPMNAIIGFSELLHNDITEPKHRQRLQSIRTSADSLLQIINDILDMSKIEAGVMELRLEPTDPREICDFIHTVFSEPAIRKNIKLECHIPMDLPHALILDRIRLRQVLVNLVGNAVKFTDKGRVDVRIMWEKQQTSSHVTLIIEIEDTGVGVPKDKLDSIFKPFTQSGVHKEKEKQGTGLGLSIVKRLTEIMGGTVAVASVMGQGSTFHLRFPNVTISARLPVSMKLSDSSEVDFNELRQATILVVDDNETNCQLIAGMFDHSHHRLFYGSSGEDAVEVTQKIKPDIILLDIRMPGMGGRAALDEIRRKSGMELLPIIAVTASNLLDEENPLRERFSGYLRKPFSKQQLFEELAQFLPRKKKSDAVTAPGNEKINAIKLPPILSPVPKELVTQLRQLLITPWPSIRESGAINESRAFAQNLESLGKRWECPPLVAYAQRLLADADNYAVTDLEKHLAEFALLVEQLAKNIKE